MLEYSSITESFQKFYSTVKGLISHSKERHGPQSLQQKYHFSHTWRRFCVVCLWRISPAAVKAELQKRLHCGKASSRAEQQRVNSWEQQSS